MLDRDGGFEGPAGSSGSGASTSSCEDDSQCTDGTTCRPARCQNRMCGSDVAETGTACSDDDGEVCNGQGQCVRKDGRECGSGPQCLSGYCVDGLCCDTSCLESCENCNAPGAEGVCTPYQAATDPEQECQDGICDGSSHCATGESEGVSLQFGDAYDQLGTAVALDADGNRYITVAFVNTITFAVTHVGSPVYYDIAVAKLTPAGAPVWSRHFAGTFHDIPSSIVLDDKGDVFVAGWFSNQLDIGGTIHTSNGDVDMFVAKLDKEGDRVWSRSFGSVGQDAVNEIAVDADGDVLLGGYSSGIMSVDDGATTLAFNGVNDAVVAKLDGDDGAAIWSASFGGAVSDGARAVAVDENGAMLVTGVFGATVSFGATSLNASALDGYLMKLGTDGALIWATQLGGIGDDVGRALEALDDGGVVAGDFSAGITLGSDVFPGGDAYRDAFVARFDDQGNIVWGSAFAGAYDQVTHELGLDASGNVVLVGANNGTGTAGLITLASAGAFDAYVLKLAADGTPLWGLGFGAGADQSADAVAIDEEGNAVVVGWFQGSIDFGDGNPHVSAGLADVFLMARTP